MVIDLNINITEKAKGMSISYMPLFITFFRPEQIQEKTTKKY